MDENIIILQTLVVFACVVGVIVYRVIMGVDYCPGMSAVECLMITTVLSSVLNGVSILLLGMVRGRRGRDHIGRWIYNYLCNQCISPLML